LSKRLTDPDADPPECFLRILSGPHLGVCVPLPVGEYTIGNDDRSDFLISDEAINETHAVLRVSRGEVELASSENGATTYLHGEPIGDAAMAIAPEQVFTLGKTHFILTESGKGDAPAVELPTIRRELETDEDDTEEPEESTGDGAEPDTVESPDSEVADREEPAKGVSPGCIIVVLLVLALAGYAAWKIINRGAPSDDETEVVATVPPGEAAKAVLAEKFPDETGVSSSYDEDLGVLAVEGTVSSSAVKTQITRDMRAIDPRARVKISSMSAVVSSIRAALDRGGAKRTSLDLGLDWNLTLAGEVDSAAQQEALLKDLPQEFPRLQEIDSSKLWNRENLVAVLSDATTEAGLEDLLSFSLEGETINIDGELVVQDRERLALVKKTIEEQTGGIFQLDDKVKFMTLDAEAGWVPAAPEEVASPSLPPGDGEPDRSATELPKRPAMTGAEKSQRTRSVTAELAQIKKEETAIKNFQNITVGPISWIVTQDGEKLLQGATMPSGFVLEEIDQDFVRLKRESETKTINLK